MYSNSHRRLSKLTFFLGNYRTTGSFEVPLPFIDFFDMDLPTLEKIWPSTHVPLTQSILNQRRLRTEPF